MARQTRLHYPSALYHVTQRGNAGQDIFFDAQDRTRFFLLLQEGLARYGHRIHAYCLMTNHFHLAIQVGEVPLSKIMQNLSFRYTRWVNFRKSRFGHLFQGRYKAVLVDSDAYLLELIRYIHLNPVKAGMVTSPEDYPWSGHRSYLGLEQTPWLTSDFALGCFSSDLPQARRCYQGYVEDGMENGLNLNPSADVTDKRILGDDKFAEGVLSAEDNNTFKRVPLDRLVAVVCKAYGVSVEALAAPGKGRWTSEARAMAALLLQMAGDGSLTALADVVGRDVSSLSSSAKRLRLRVQQDAEMEERMTFLRDTLLEITKSQL